MGEANVLNIYPIALLIIIFANCKIAKKGEFSDIFWNRNQSQSLQAAACLAIILHHLTQEVTVYGTVYLGPATILSSMGILFTSLFFFFSGYGLIVSVDCKPNYLKTFLRHRLSVILVPFFMANLIGVLILIFYNHVRLTPTQIINCLLGYTLINGNAWYIVEIFFLYIGFYVTFRLFKNKHIASTLLIIFTCIIIKIAFSNGHDTSSIGNHWFMGEWWFNSTITFIMGILFGRFKNPIVSFSKKHYLFKLIFVSILFIASFIIEERIRISYGYYFEGIAIDVINSKLITFIAQSILCVIWTYLILLINLKISFHSKILSFISIYSTEIFLIHGYFLNNIFSKKSMNPFILFSCVIICGILAGIVMHYLDNGILRIIHFKKDVAASAKANDSSQLKIIIDKLTKLGIKKIFAFLCVIVIIIATVFTTIITIKNQLYFKKELSQMSEVHIGDVIEFGKYNTNSMSLGKEPVEWMVIDIVDDKIMLLSTLGLDGSVYSHQHAATTWEDSDLRDYLNNKMYFSLFNKKERSLIITNPDTNDVLSLLSVQEANTYFKDDQSRQLSLSNVAEKKGVYVNTLSKANSWDMKGYRSSWWWLRGTASEITAPIVSVDGEIITDKKYVNKPNGAIRPVIYVCLPAK